MYQVIGTIFFTMKLLQTKMSRIDYDLIINIKSLREQNGWSQRTLSKKMGLASTFVGKVESLSQPEKYNIRHVNLLIKAFNFKTVDQIFPKKMPFQDMVIIHYKKVPKLKKDKTPSKFDEEVVVKIERIEKKEI